MPPAKTRPVIFVSSVQKEFTAERRALKDYIESDALLGKYFQVFLFEDLPAKSRRADHVYLGEAGRCEIYVGMFGQRYGTEDKAGVSATEREFDAATDAGKPRFVYLKELEDERREPKMKKLIEKADGEVIRKRFGSIPELTGALYASLVEHLTEKGDIRSLPFDAAFCPRAKLGDLDPAAVTAFLKRAREGRGYALAPTTPVADVLTHLDLLDGGRPSHAAVLLFGRQPQRLLLTSHVKCLHFHGTEVSKPIPSYQTYTGPVFELIDQAADFVLSKVNSVVGTRAASARAPVAYELPAKAVREAIVNAVAHRDYASKASVQVMLFADRLEVRNPGHLPPSLTPESLRHPHASVPRNPLLAEPLFLAGYVERAGTGTLDMIKLCAAAGLPAPEFRHEGGFFVQTLWRDRWTPSAIALLGLNDRQQQVLTHLRRFPRITNLEFQQLVKAPRRTAVRDLMALVKMGLLESTGAGRGVVYVLRNRATNVPNVPQTLVAGQGRARSDTNPGKRAKNAPNVPQPKRAKGARKPAAPHRKRGR